MLPKFDTGKSTVRTSERTSMKTGKVAENEKMSEKDEQSDKIVTEIDTDSNDAKLVVNQTLFISAMNIMLAEALEKQVKRLNTSN